MKMRLRTLLVLSLVLSLACGKKGKPKGGKPKGGKPKGGKPKGGKPKGGKGVNANTNVAALWKDKQYKGVDKLAILFDDGMAREYLQAMQEELKKKKIGVVLADEESRTLRYELGGKKGKKGPQSYGVESFPALRVLQKGKGKKASTFGVVPLDLKNLGALAGNIGKTKADKKLTIAPKGGGGGKGPLIGAVVLGLAAGAGIGVVLGMKKGGGWVKKTKAELAKLPKAKQKAAKEEQKKKPAADTKADPTRKDGKESPKKGWIWKAAAKKGKTKPANKTNTKKGKKAKSGKKDKKSSSKKKKASGKKKKKKKP